MQCLIFKWQHSLKLMTNFKVFTDRTIFHIHQYKLNVCAKFHDLIPLPSKYCLFQIPPPTTRDVRKRFYRGIRPQASSLHTLRSHGHVCQQLPGESNMCITS